MVSTHLKNISQIGSFPQVEVKIKNIWNHHLDVFSSTFFARKSAVFGVGPFYLSFRCFLSKGKSSPLAQKKQKFQKPATRIIPKQHHQPQKSYKFPTKPINPFFPLKTRSHHFESKGPGPPQCHPHPGNKASFLLHKTLHKKPPRFWYSSMAFLRRMEMLGHPWAAQAVTFLSPNVGGHVYNLWNGHVFTFPKRKTAELPGKVFLFMVLHGPTLVVQASIWKQLLPREWYLQYTLGVQRPLNKWSFRKGHYFSRDL